MELSELQYFRVVANLEHVTKAAQKLHVSQPNLSNAITRLENKLGAKLFERTRGKIRLTDVGREYLRYVNDAFVILEEGEMHVHEMTESRNSRVMVSCSINKLMNTVIESYVSGHSNVLIHQSLLPTENIVHQFERNEVDFAITFRPIQGPQLEWIPIFKSELLVGVSKNHPFANKASIRLQDLADQPFVCNNVGADMVILQELCAVGGFSPKLSFESNDGQFIGEILQRDRMLALIPALDYYEVATGGFANVQPLHPLVISDYDAHVTVGITKRADKPMNRTTKEFLEFTKDSLLKRSALVDEFIDQLNLR